MGYAPHSAIPNILKLSKARVVLMMKSKFDVNWWVCIKASEELTEHLGTPQTVQTYLVVPFAISYVFFISNFFVRTFRQTVLHLWGLIN